MVKDVAHSEIILFSILLATKLIMVKG